jgi:uncharacterized protein YuzE
MADIKKSVNLLPEYLKTDKNSKFLSGTIDPLIQSPQLERIDGFVGSKITPNYNPTTDFYIKEDLPLRKEYSLEPGLVFKDQSSNITDVVGFDDIINELSIQGGNTEDLDRLFRSKFYSYDPFIAWDKLVNYRQYYWLPNGPDAIVLDGASPSTLFSVNFVGSSTFTMPNGYALSNGMKIQFGLNVTPASYINNEYYVEGVGSSIKLINIKLLEVNESAAGVYNETFDSTAFDSYSFDGSKKLPLTPEYITINRASSDLNPWTRYNRWFHGEIIRITSEINNVAVVYPLDARANRPIVEFNSNIQLYNFGSQGRENIDLIDNDTTDAFAIVTGTLGYYVDGILLEHGNRVVFNADTALTGKIYKVQYSTSTEYPTSAVVIELIEDTTSVLMDSVAVNYGIDNAGTSWHYASVTDTNNVTTTKWIKSQQHITVNQAPLFDLYDSNTVSFSNRTPGSSSFTGSKIFGYEVGTGTADIYLGFPLKYQNSIGVGSYLFKNYFMSDVISITDDNNVSSNTTTGITYLKVDEVFLNVWKLTADYQTPIVEIQTAVTATNTLVLTSLTTTATSVIASVNSTVVKSTLAADGITVTIDPATSIKVNDVVSFEITSNSIPNKNGFYKTPLGLTNNPLNGQITSMTLSELSDHLSTMVSRTPVFSGVFLGTNNLRDLTNYSIYGTRLIVNANPIAFTQVFLGKKEHNVVDALRQAADQYNQFKMNLLRSIASVDNQLNVADALDKVLKDINANRDSRSPYYNSDMLGYGLDKIVKEYTVSTSSTVTYATPNTVDLTELSFKSLLVYLNDVQLIVGTEYTIDAVDSTITIIEPLAINDVLAVHYYENTIGAYVPATPSKLGIYPKYAPSIYSDTTYIDAPVTVISGHDGSIMTAYGDYRDAIILEFEKRVYNNIKVAYNPAIFDITASMPGAFRESKYLLADATSILTKDFIKWTGSYNIDATTNNVTDTALPWTWNYNGGVDVLLGNTVSGYWRGLFKYFYDTDRPDTHPWEMLGYSSKPALWDTYYSWLAGPKRTALISAITNGYTGQLPSTTVNANYARPGFSAIVPVDTLGVLKDPASFLVGEITPDNKIASWVFGNQSPAETAWRRSSYWPFVANVAAALLDPCSYTSTMYDVSRTSLNSIGQVTYLADDLYLNPNKLLIDGEVQTAGFGVYLVERGKHKDLNYVASLKQDLTYINFNLFHKLGGFASKDKLQVVIDSIDPVSVSQGAILPPEDYSLLLNVSNPIKSVNISGVVVQKFEGKFILKGYDKTTPYFEIFKPIRYAGTLTVGGKSASFTEWTGTVNNGNSGLSAIDITSTTANTTHYYKQGQIVRYNGTYYVVKVGHTSQPTFNTAYFQALPSLPMTGGATVQLPAAFAKNVTQVPYGTSFSTVQDVYDTLVCYGVFLESQGFIFDEYNADLNEVVDWKYTGKEFLYWSTQNWADGNLITLSPFVDYLKYTYIDSIVDDISTGKYEYSLLKADGKSFPIDKFRLSREDSVCTISTIDTLEGMFFATLNSVQKEHAMVFNNTTIFNDTIYDIETGYKQRRIKLSGFRTANWNGDLSSPGFVYDSIDVSDWIAYGTYIPGKVVRYNGAYYEANLKIVGDATFDFAKWAKLDGKPVSNLLPNFDYKINQFEDFYSLDIDNFDATQQKLAQHLVGYTPRIYFDNIFTNPVSQYKFYQGYIKEKGTKNAIDKLAKVGKFTRQGEITFNEDWAFRVGNYGSFNTFKEIEFTLDESTALENPYLVKFASAPANANPLINYVSASSLLLTPDDYVQASTFVTNPSTFADNGLVLTTAGYVRADDVTATAYNKNSLLDIANNSLIQEGDTIWMGFLDNGDWGVSRYSKQTAKIAGVYISAPGVDITFSTDINHNLSVGDIISIVRFNSQVDGIHIVTAIPRLDQFTVASTLTTIVNADLLSFGALFKFEDVRYTSIADLSKSKELLKLKVGEKLWIDEGVDDKWQVYEKVKNYSTTPIITTGTSGQHLGQSIYTADGSDVVMLSVPGWAIPQVPTSNGSIWVYTKHKGTGILDKQFEYALNSASLTYAQPSVSTEFGYSLSYDVNKGLYFAGAPAASYVLGATGTPRLSPGSGTPSSFVNEGLVKISSNTALYAEVTEAVLANPNAANHTRFGHSVYVTQSAANTLTTLLVGAPGDIVNTSTIGRVYAYSVTTSTITVHALGNEIVSNGPLHPGSQFGHKIAGDETGSIIAISAPYHDVNTSTVGVVQIFTGTNLTYTQQITSPFGTNDAFGVDVAVSSDGIYLFISSSDAKKVSEPYGKVAVYTLNTATWLYDIANLQTIDNPYHRNDLKFGTAISISKDNNTLAISALGINNSEIKTFDIGSREGETTFDGGTTRFTEVVPDAGTVYVYNNLDGYFIQAEELFDESILPGCKFGASIIATNNEVLIGAPSVSTATSILYQFAKNDITLNSWNVVRQQVDLTDVSTVDRVALIDSLKEEIVDYLEVIDPLKGKIAGIAEQELKYKSAFDPATYTIGLASTIIDANTSWIDDHVGELWWDLSTAKYMWYEQGDDTFRKNNWGKLFPGSSIDVYEWVKSDLLPSEWAAQADTNDGLTNGISGQPKYPDNSIVSVKQLFNNVTNAFENVYFFWVKNKVTVPNVKNRRISSYQVAGTIADPVANGLKFIEILSTDSVAFANVQPMLVGNKINANIAIDTTNNEIPRHTEWLLLAEGDANGIPTTLLEKKLFDSLLGHDFAGNAVPATDLTYRSRYGISIRPQQSLFKDRIQALHNLVEFTNSVLIKNRITGNYNFDNLNSQEQIPDTFSREYDFVVEDVTALNAVYTYNYALAEIECNVTNGKITSVDIISSGYGYTLPPKVTIVSDTENNVAEILTEINSTGEVIGVTISNAGSGFATIPPLIVRPQTVIVRANEDYNSIWTKHQFDYASQAWVRIKNQTYNTSLYWETVDWISNEYSAFKDYAYVIEEVSELSSLADIKVGDYVKINNVVNGLYYIIIERMADTEVGNFSTSYNIVFSENGTIQILDSIWDYSFSNYAYDIATLDETLYDQIPDLEVFYILTALKNDIFINDLKVNWNLFFFKAVRYALTEQKLLDWAFKTSFINVTNVIGVLDQRAVYKLDDEKYFEDYIKEVKPYHSQIRTYASNYTCLEDSSAGQLDATDFDLPSYFNTATNQYEVVNSSNTSTMLTQQPWKAWADNYTSEIGSIIVSEPGTRYTGTNITVTISGGGPLVTTNATAKAYIRSGGIYQILVTNPGAGYTQQPIVTISGGGPLVTTNATASATLLNLTTRKNKIGIKFDRVNAQSEIGVTRVTDSFICNGETDKFVLSWVADTDKLNILPTLDGKLILSSDYTLEYYTAEYNGHTKQYSRFVFLTTIPLADQVFKISYNKNINLFTAVDRIENYYTSTAVLSTLMTGTVYPGSVLQGLPFDYSVPWDTVRGNGKYDVTGSAWSELVNYYASAKLVTTATVGATTLYLNTTTGIVAGQVINILNSSTIRVRADTVVTSVNASARSITISSPSFRILHAVSTTTTVGSDIAIKTIPPFNGGLIVGDSITITGIAAGGYNGSYTVASIMDADQFMVTATSVLSTITSIPTLISSATVTTLLTTVDSNEVTLDHFVQTYNIPVHHNYISPENDWTPDLVVKLYIPYVDISNLQIFDDGALAPMLNGVPVIGPYFNAEWYYVTTDIDGFPIVSFYHMVNASYELTFYVYGNPTIEFWKPETMVSGLDSAVSAGSWNNTGFVGALGVSPTDTIIDGDSFLNVCSGYAPEELVAGHTLDSLGINVYTKADNSYATVLSGAFPVTAGIISTATLSMPSDNFAGEMIHYNGRIFNKLLDSLVSQGPYFSSEAAVPAGLIGIAIATTAGDDTFTGPYPLNMSWNMFGTVYTEVYVGTNGYLTFGGGSSLYTPLTIAALPYPSIMVEYCDLWQAIGELGQPLSTGETPGLFMSSGTVGAFEYWRLRFQGTHYNQRNTMPTAPAFDYEVTLYSNGTDQYVEMIYENTWRSVNVGIDTYTGFVTGIATANAGSSFVELPYTSILDNTSHVFYSTANGGNWQYAGQGKFNPDRNPFGFSGIDANEYYVIGNTIYLAPQSTSGRAGYTLVSIGGNSSVIDSNMVVVTSATTAIVTSLASVNDIQQAYVLVDGAAINNTTSTSVYYVLTEVGTANKRACVKVYNLDAGSHTIEAWFFESKYTKFNRVHEEIFLVDSTLQSAFTLTLIPGMSEPVSSQVIVELGLPGTPTSRRRLLPPPVSYYQISNNQVTFNIDNKAVHFQNTYNIDNVKVYANGIELRTGFDYTIDTINSTVTIATGLLNNGDVLAIVGMIDQEYIISENILDLMTPVSDTTLKVTSFTDHDNMLIRTERFVGNSYRKFVLSFPTLNDNYVWVYLNGIPLTARYDFEILDDLRTIQISDWVLVTTSDEIMITTVNPPSVGSQVLGFRVFNDIFDRHHFKRLSAFHSTTLSQPLHYTDAAIYVTDASKLIPPNPLTNKPGIVLIDGERIEFFVKDGNILRQLRRSTLGTGPAAISYAGTTVIDQSPQQDMPYVESTFVQTTSTTSLTYIINTVTNDITGDGITLAPGIDAVDQVTVYYGGRQLRKSPLVVHDSAIAYDTTSTSVSTLPPEFTITTATNELVLNISDSSINNTSITIVQRQCRFWTGILSDAESLLTSNAIQAKFLREQESALPTQYYYGGTYSG